MNLSGNMFVKTMIGGLSWVLMLGGGICFWVGGRALHEFAGVNRVIAELEGLAVAAALIALGAGLRALWGLPLGLRSRRGA